MAHKIYNLDASYWTVSSNNLQTNNMVSADTQAYIIDPNVLNTSGFDKSKTNMTKAEFNAHFTNLTPGTTSVPNASNFAVSNWSAKGWGSTAADILASYYTFIDNNFVNGTNSLQINAASRDLQTLLVSGTISGTAYFLPIAIYGQQGVSSPSAPTSVTATVGDAQVPLSWTAPSNGGSAITDYVIQYSSNSGSTWTTFSDGTSTSTSTTVTGLSNGTSYIFRVAAINSVGQGSYSASSNAVTPATLYPMVIGVRTSAGSWQPYIISDTEPVSTDKRWAWLTTSNNLLATDNRFGSQYFGASPGTYKVRAYTSDNNGVPLANNVPNEKVRWLSAEVTFTVS